MRLEWSERGLSPRRPPRLVPKAVGFVKRA